MIEFLMWWYLPPVALVLVAWMFYQPARWIVSCFIDLPDRLSKEDRSVALTGWLVRAFIFGVPPLIFMLLHLLKVN